MTKSPEISSGLKTNPEHKKHMSKKALVGRLAVALFIVANAGMGIKHHIDYNSPYTPAGILDDIVHIPQDWILLVNRLQMNIAVSKELNKPALPNYDSKSDSQIIQPAINGNPISKNELPSLLKDAIKPIEKNSSPNESILFPVKMADDQKIKVDTQYPQLWNPITKEFEKIPDGKTLTIQKKGTEIIMPVEGAEIFKMVPKDRGFVGISVHFFGPDGAVFDLRITPASGNPNDIELTEAVIKAPSVEILDLIRNTPNVAKGKGLAIKPGDSILRTTVSNAAIDFTLMIISPNYTENRRSCDFFFLTNEQNNKIFYVPAGSNH